MVDIAIIVIVLLLGIWGFRRGLIKSVFSIVSYIASLVLSWILYPYVSDFLSKTPLYPAIQSAVQNNYVVPNTPTVTNLPSMFGNSINDTINASLGSISAGVTNSVTGVVLAAISIVAVFILCRLILFVVGKLISGVASLPGIRFFDRLGGLALGIAEGILVIYLIMAVVAIFVPVSGNPAVSGAIDNSTLAKQMYNNNFILNIAAPAIPPSGHSSPGEGN